MNKAFCSFENLFVSEMKKQEEKQMAMVWDTEFEITKFEML